jgi:hypothetical protein
MVIVFWVSEPDNLVVPKMWFADHKKWDNGSQVIRGYISVMATLKFTYYLNKKVYVLLKIILVTSLVGDMLISYNRYVIKKTPDTQQRATAKLCNVCYVSYWSLFVSIENHFWYINL